jgi:glutamate transport system substrate-binding protein
VSAACGPQNDPTPGASTATPSQDVLSGTIAVKIHSDQPSWGWLVLPNTFSGFDYDLGNWIADLEDFQPSYSAVTSAAREQELINSDGRMIIIATYSITDTRRKKVGQAGPYMITQQGIMVRAGDGEIRTSQDLVGKMVCTAGGTTSQTQLKELGAVVVTRPGFAQCHADLKSGQVRALSTDLLILEGFAQNDPALSVVEGVTFGAAEHYGIGYKHGDLNMCLALTNAIRKFITSGAWDTFYTAHRLPEKLRKVSRPDPNLLDEC